VSQIQGRTYANMFGLVERFIGAKILEVSRDHWLGDQTALEALVRFTDEELKHQELFRRLEQIDRRGMHAGYDFRAAVPMTSPTRSFWRLNLGGVGAHTATSSLFTQAHYPERASSPITELSLGVDRTCSSTTEAEEYAARILDELEWLRARDAKLLRERRRRQGIGRTTASRWCWCVVDGCLDSWQATADAEYFVAVCGRALAAGEADAVRADVPRRPTAAVHRLGRAGRALPEDPGRNDHRAAGYAHRQRARAVARRDA